MLSMALRVVGRYNGFDGARGSRLREWQCLRWISIVSGVVQLGERIQQDWETRCAAAGAGAPPEARVDGLTVRVVNITEKAVEVKPQFRAQFDNYPSHFKFKQKVILLFQAIEGVDVLLFIVFVQARRCLLAAVIAAARMPIGSAQRLTALAATACIVLHSEFGCCLVSDGSAAAECVVAYFDARHNIAGSSSFYTCRSTAASATRQIATRATSPIWTASSTSGPS